MPAKKTPTIQQTDRRLNKLAKAATSAAYHQALDSGHSVLIANNGEIRRITPDGKSTVIKKIEPNVSIKKGTVIKVK